MSFDISDVGPTPASFQGSTPVRSGSGRILSLVMASDDQRAYAGTYAGVFRSDDGGRSFRQMSRPQPGVYDADVPGAFYAPHIFDLAVSPGDPDIVLAAAWRSQFKPSRNGVYRSADGGLSWTLVQPGNVGQIAFAPDDPSLAIAALGTGVAVSHDAGVTWAFQALDPAWHVAIGPLEASGVRRVYAAGANTIWRSIDGGASWRGDAGATIVAQARAQTSAFIVANGGGAIPAFADGTTDVGGPGPHALAIEPGNPQILYLAASGGTFGLSYYARRPDGTKIPDGTEANVTPDRLAGEGSLWIGDFSDFDANGAAAWQEVPPSPLYSGATTPSGCVWVLAKQTPSGFLLFFADMSSVYVVAGRPTNSVDWHRLDGRDASYDARAGELYDHLLVHVDPHALMTTSDFDITLKPAFGVSSPYDQNSELDQDLGGTILMANDGGVQWSVDGGATWTPSTGLPTLDPVNIAGLAGLGPEPALYMGTGDNDSFFTTDGGQTWRDTSVHLGDADGWFADTAQARVLQFAPRAGGMFLFTGGGYPDASGSGHFVPPPASSNASSGHVLRGYAPLVLTLATEPAQSDGDTVVIGARSDGVRVLFRTLAISSIASASDWEDRARAVQVGPPLPAGVDIVQAVGGHFGTVFYISDGASLWTLDPVAQQWVMLAPGGPPGQSAGSAQRFFADPFNPALIYLLDGATFCVSLDSGQSWNADPFLTAAMTGGGKLDLTAGGVVRGMLFLRTERFTRFAFGSAGVMYTMDGVVWQALINSIAMGGCPESGFFDGITDPLNRTLYVEFEGRSVLRLSGITAPPPPTPPDPLLLELAAILHEA
jgi:photosystem II stability/assembly factor-like uncharacterized protein